MKTIIFIFHPNLTKGSRINHTLPQAAAKKGFKVRDLYALYPDFQIDVKKEQEVLAAADRIVFQFPIYWYQVPALMKQWLDDVLEYGWAYGSTGTALRGKQLFLVPSFGAGADDYTLTGRFQATFEEILRPIETIKFHTGVDYQKPFITAGALNLSEKDCERKAQSYVECLKS